MNVRVEDLLATDWPEKILAICAKKRWRYADLARHLIKCGCGNNVQVLSAELGRLGRSEIAEPRVTIAVKLMDMYQGIRGETNG